MKTPDPFERLSQQITEYTIELENIMAAVAVIDAKIDEMRTDRAAHRLELLQANEERDRLLARVSGQLEILNATMSDVGAEIASAARQLADLVEPGAKKKPRLALR
jgi:chromosome segregation ATPase